MVVQFTQSFLVSSDKMEVSFISHGIGELETETETDKTHIVAY